MVERPSNRPHLRVAVVSIDIPREDSARNIDVFRSRTGDALHRTHDRRVRLARVNAIPMAAVSHAEDHAVGVHATIPVIVGSGAKQR